MKFKFMKSNFTKHNKNTKTSLKSSASTIYERTIFSKAKKKADQYKEVEEINNTDDTIEFKDPKNCDEIPGTLYYGSSKLLDDKDSRIISPNIIYNGCTHIKATDDFVMALFKAGHYSHDPADEKLVRIFYDYNKMKYIIKETQPLGIRKTFNRKGYIYNIYDYKEISKFKKCFEIGSLIKLWKTDKSFKYNNICEVENILTILESLRDIVEIEYLDLSK